PGAQPAAVQAPCQHLLWPRARRAAGSHLHLSENWAAGLEQTMLIVLVLGRWLMPKGDMSRDQLSQLLMVYVGLGADILDIFDTFKEPEVKTNRAIIIMGLALFSWALMQFPLVLTQTSPPKAHLHLLLTVGLQDGPFLIYRLYLMIRENVLNQLMIFFTCKNILVVLLEFYRIFVVQWQKPKRAPRGTPGPSLGNPKVTCIT
uniref:Transmembrane protein 26 n=1 Tax=Hucho hucho TaxID=62062 RepID=A0A4W5KTP5_9TELE